jgi:hypothetical protein
MTQTQYEGYFVTEQGDVFSTKYNSIKKLKPSNNGTGYIKIGLSNNNKVKQMLVHRLIAETFIPNPKNKCDVNHKNGLKTDNRVENLEWVTPKENMDHAISIGLVNTIGANNAASKLTEQQVLEIRELYSTKSYTYTTLSKMFGVSFQQISNIINKKKWKHI